jgi:hypothetical protein
VWRDQGGEVILNEYVATCEVTSCAAHLISEIAGGHNFIPTLQATGA